MLEESPLALAALAGRMVIDAAATSGWETAQRKYAQLLGRGNAKQTQLVERWLEETREQLAGGAGADMELIRTALAGRWAGRWADLLEENPDAAAELRALVGEIQAAVPAEGRLASGHAVAANGDASAFAAGPEHPGALATRSELAYSVGQAGDAAAARDQFAALLPVAERVLGPEHPDTLAARASLAYWTGQAGDAAAARDQFAALLPVAERVLGPEHPDTSSTATTWPTSQATQEMRPPPGTSSPRCSASASAYSARTLPIRWWPGSTWPTGPGVPGPPPMPGTSSPRCSPSARE